MAGDRSIRGFQLVRQKELDMMLARRGNMYVPVMLNYRWAIAAGWRDRSNDIYKIRGVRQETGGYAVHLNEFKGPHTFKLTKEGLWVFFRKENKIGLNRLRITLTEPVFMLPVLVEDGCVKSCIYCGVKTEFYGTDFCKDHGPMPDKSFLIQYPRVSPVWLQEGVRVIALPPTIRRSTATNIYPLKHGDQCPECNSGKLEFLNMALKCSSCWQVYGI
jgi:hypothetical protein